MKRFVTIVVVALTFAFAIPSRATSFSTDQSDLWWNANESGWGIQFVQRGSIIFATMFVYDPSGKPVWYTATLTPQAGANTWAGDLYVTNGPWLGTGTFNPALVGLRQVGTMNWYGQFVESGVLTFSVDGVPVTKNIQRQLLVYDNYSGTYKGAIHVAITGCVIPANNTSGEMFETFVVTQNGQNVAVILLANGVALSITGTLTQAGQFGAISGSYFFTTGDPLKGPISTGEVGNATLSAMNVQINTLTASVTLSSTNNGCQSTGYIAGVRVR